MKFCGCEYRKIVNSMMAIIEFNELTGYENDDYKQVFIDLVKEHSSNNKEENDNETDKITQSKVG